jgi:2'-hydroxyisoflavone reductase
MKRRREFLKAAAAGAAAMAARLPLLAHAAASLTPTPHAPLRILILGGTGYIGPHLVKHAVARGHHVTIFTRGRRDPALPDSIERLVGARNGQLQALEGKRWDAVIDDSATNPDWVRQSTALLKDAAGRYLFTSSTGVYYPYLKRPVDETTPVMTDLADPSDASMKFGTDKAKCEALVMSAFGPRGAVIRSSYIVGPGDTSNRYPYWPQRLARGGEVLAPGRADDPVQMVDVRDLAEFMVTLIENDRGGIYNAAGPKTQMMVRDFYAQAAAALNAKVTFVYVDDYAFLDAHTISDVVPFIMLRGNDYGHTSATNTKAIAAGLSFRPLATTARDTLTWWNTVVPEQRRKDAVDAAKPGHFAILPDQEAAALKDWKAR